MAQSRGVERVKEKLENAIREERYYEAHQLYKSIFFRYLNQKKYQDLLNVLYDGAKLLLSHGQYSSGSDVASMMLEVLEKSNRKPDDECVSRIVDIFGLMSSDDRQQYILRAVKWSAAEGASEVGHPKLHQELGKVLWREKQYFPARYHYLRSDDGKSCATLLIEIHLLKGYPSEVDTFLAQAIFQYLCLQKKPAANKAFETYTTNHPHFSKGPRGPPYMLPLLNFLWFLLLAVEKGKVTEFTVLCEQYQPTIKRDPCFREYLDRIGQLFFAVPPPPQQPSLFGNILQGLIGGLDDEDSSSSRQPLAQQELD